MTQPVYRSPSHHQSPNKSLRANAQLRLQCTERASSRQYLGAKPLCVAGAVLPFAHTVARLLFEVRSIIPALRGLSDIFTVFFVKSTVHLFVPPASSLAMMLPATTLILSSALFDTPVQVSTSVDLSAFSATLF